MNYYTNNLETGKIHLYFEKADYMGLRTESKKEIKSTFLFSRNYSAWVSRSKNNLNPAIQVANKLGLENRGEEGEKLSFEEKLERKQDRASARADRFRDYHHNSVTRQENFQAEFNRLRKDWSWITQPNVNTSAGRAFTNQRNKVVARYEKGFEETDKQSYYEGRIDAAEATAAGEQYNDVSFLNRRIKEREAEIRKIKRNIEPLEEQLIQGKRKAYIDNQSQIVALTDDEKLKISSVCLKWQDIIEEIDDELSFYKKKLSEVGGVLFSKETLKESKVLYIVYRGKTYPVKSFNQKTVTVLNWLSIAHFTWLVPYSEVQKTFTESDTNIVVQDKNGNEVKPTIKY